MKLRNALILLLLAVLVGAGGWYFGRDGGGSERMPVAHLAFPGLVDKLGQAEKIDIAQSGKEITLVRNGEIWGIAQKFNYPVIPAAVHGLFAALSELRLQEPRTADPALLGRLGLADPTVAGSTVTTVRVLDGKGAALAEILMGNKRTATESASATPGASQMYVRMPGNPQSWLAEGNLDPSIDIDAWIKRDIANIPRKRISAIEVSRPDGDLAFATKDDKLAMVTPAEHPALDDSKLTDLSAGLEWITCTDEMPADQQPGTVIGQVVFHTTDGLTVTARVSQADKAVWAHFTVTGTDKAADEATKLAPVVDGWAYQIGAWKLKALVPSLDDLKAPPPKPVAATAPEVAPTPSAAVPPEATKMPEAAKP
jgi:hypothetical protein